MSMPVIRPSGATRTQAISDIIESVALEETGLSHILNAEGEKIQKFVEKATSASQLLAVNQSAEATIAAISRLEMVLQGKLDLFSCVICR